MEPDFGSVNFRKVGAYLFGNNYAPCYYPDAPTEYVKFYIKDSDGVTFIQLLPINPNSETYAADIETLLIFISMVFSTDVETLVTMFS